MSNEPNKDIKPKKIGNIYPSGGENGNIYDPNGIAPTIKAGTGVKGRGIGSCNAPKIIVTDREEHE